MLKQSIKGAIKSKVNVKNLPYINNKVIFLYTIKSSRSYLNEVADRQQKNAVSFRKHLCGHYQITSRNVCSGIVNI